MPNTESSYPLLSPSLAVRDAGKAIQFYVDAFDAEERFRLVDPLSGKIGHAELTINGSLVTLADEYAEYNTSPETLGGTAVKLTLMVDDVDASVDQAIAAGATVIMPATDAFYGHRSACVRDPYGHEWNLQRELERVPPAEMQRRWDAMPKD